MRLLPDVEQVGAGRDTAPAVQTTLTPGQLSEAVALKVATAEHWPASLFLVMLVGQVVNVGLTSSFTVNVAVHEEL